MKWITQFIHLFLIVATVGLYAWLMAILPADDPWRVRMSCAVAVATAIWGALVFVEALRLKDQNDLKERVLGAYRRLLNRGITLVLSTMVLGALAGWFVDLGAGYGPVEFSSDTDRDVAVFLSDPEKSPQQVAVIPAGKRVSVRLPIGRHFFYFATAQGKVVPYRTVKIDVPPIWGRHNPETISVPEVPKYARN